MGIEDEKTKLKIKAVKRKTPAAIAEVATRQVKAVKRKTADPFASFLAVKQVALLKRGGLLNEAGQEDNGWLLRDLEDHSKPAWFVMRHEPFLETFSRLLVDQAYDFDVMCGGDCIAGLQLERVTSTHQSGTAYLLGPENALLAKLRVKGPYEVEGFDEAEHKIFRLVKEHPTQFSLMVGRRSIGRMLRVAQPGVVFTSYQLELSFDSTATGFERLCAAAAVFTGEAWVMARDTSQNGRGRSNLLSLF